MAALQCSTAVASAQQLSHVHIAFAAASSAPFGVAVSKAGDEVFVATGSGRIDTYTIRNGAPVLTRSASYGSSAFLGLAISPNGKYLLAAENGGAAVINISTMESSASASSPGYLGALTSPGSGAIEVTVAPGGDFAFVSLEDSEELAVFNLVLALRDKFGPNDLVGFVPVEMAPVGMAVSNDGRYLYATSELARLPSHAAARRAPGPISDPGTLSTIDIATAEADPVRSVVSTVDAGCSPVRVVADAHFVYVDARESDTVATFNAAALVTQPKRALVGATRVGEAPVGLALANDDHTLLVADSNRFGFKGASSSLAWLRLRSDGVPKLTGYLSAGLFPRDMALDTADGEVFVANYSSGQLESVDARSG
jgi:DNA-binding beta-propeller fold protein YncE